MSQLGKIFWTYKLVNDSLVVTTDYGLTALSLILVSGSGSVQGSLICNGIESTSIDLEIGVPILISTESLSLIDEWTITTSGTINIIGR
jgi:hypothetical protein